MYVYCTVMIYLTLPQKVSAGPLKYLEIKVSNTGGQPCQYELSPTKTWTPWFKWVSQSALFYVYSYTLLLGKIALAKTRLEEDKWKFILGAFLDSALCAFPWLIVIYTLCCTSFYNSLQWALCVLRQMTAPGGWLSDAYFVVGVRSVGCLGNLKGLYLQKNLAGIW